MNIILSFKTMVVVGCFAVILVVLGIVFALYRPNKRTHLAADHLPLGNIGMNVAHVIPPLHQHTDNAPRLGLISVGAFAPESMPGADLSIEGLDNDQVYRAYRQAIRSNYGSDLADMNYLGVGVDGWQRRYAALGDWLCRSSQYGDPTVAVEPVGKAGYGAFVDDPEMQDLRSVFQTAGKSRITVWVRFASESNLRFSVYSVYNDPEKIAQYRKSARWFRSYMPTNVKIVFSPLINTAYLKDPRQIHTLIAMYEPGAYDRIGGTLYATSWCRPRDAFGWYYHFMRRLDAKTPFEVCELGGIFPRAGEIEAFLLRAARGDWPGVQRVNLFAGDLNPLAVNAHGHFGFILPAQSSSYLCTLLAGDPRTAAVASESSDSQLARLEELSAGWQSPQMTLDGNVITATNGGQLVMSVTSVTDDVGETTSFLIPRAKLVIPVDGCAGVQTMSSLSKGAAIEVTGWDSGTGTTLRATEITVNSSEM
jgi:hypothetical protein